MYGEAAQGSPIAALLPYLDSSLLSAELLETAFKLDALIHGEVKDGKRRSYTGPAQKAFNAIARQNLVASLPSGKTLLLRDYYQTEDRDDKEIEVATGASLLGPIKFLREGGQSYNPTVKKSLVETIKRYLASLEARNQTNSPRHKVLSQVASNPFYSVIKPPTLLELNELFVGSADASGRLSNVSEGFGLRRPLPTWAREEFYKTKTLADVTISDYLETTLENISPTRIDIEFGEVDSELEVVETKPLRVSKQMLIRKRIREQKPTLNPLDALEEQRVNDLLRVGNEVLPQEIKDFFEIGVSTNNKIKVKIKDIPGQSLDASMRAWIERNIPNVVLGKITFAKGIAEVEIKLQGWADFQQWPIQIVSGMGGASEFTPASLLEWGRTLIETDFQAKLANLPKQAPQVDVVTRLRQEFSKEELQEFVTQMQAKDLKQAVEQYLSDSTQLMSYEQKVRTIAAAIRALRRNVTTTTLEERVREAITSSDTIMGIGREKEKFTPRDFIRAAMYLEILPDLDPKLLIEILDYARAYYAENYDGQVADLEALIQAYGGVSFDQHVTDLATAYVKVFGELGYTLEPLTGTTTEEVLSFVEKAVIQSSAYRGTQRASSSLVPTPEFLTWVNSVKTAYDANDEIILNAKLTGKKNKAHVDKLGEFFNGDVTADNIGDALQAVESFISIERQMTFTSEDENIGQLISEEEADEIVRHTTPPTLIETITSIFTGKTPNREVTRFVNFNLRQQQLGKDVWGLYKDGVISVVRARNGKVGTKIVRHELFHRIFWEYLTKEEQLRALELAEAQWGKADTITQEERLADAFGEYFTPPSTWLVALWDFMRNIWRLLGFTYNNMGSLDSLFNSIDAGYYKGSGRKVAVERTMQYIGSKFDSPEAYAFARHVVFEHFNEIFYNRKLSDRVLSYEEAVRQSLEFAKNYEPENVSVAEKRWQKKALATLTSDKAVRRGFIDEYFGSANLVQAQLIEKWKEKGEEYLETKRLIEELQELRESDEEFGEDENADLDDLLVKEANLHAEIFESELQNPEDSVTGRVKQRFVGIKYEEAGQQKYADFGSVYQFVVETFANVPTANLETVLESLRKRLAIYVDSKSNNIRAKTALHLSTLIDKLERDVKRQNWKGEPNPTDAVSFRKDVSSPLVYAVVHKQGGNANVSYEEALANPATYEIVTMDTHADFQDLVDSIKRISELSQEVVAKTYYHFEDVNFFKALLMAAGSLGRAYPHVAIQEFYYGRYKSRYIANRTSSSRKVFESKIDSGFQSYAAAQSTTLFSEQFMTDISGKTTIEDQRMAIHRFLALIGIPTDKLKTATPNDVALIYDKLPISLRAMRENFDNYYLNVQPSEEEYMSLKEIISSESTLVSNLVQMLNNNSSLIENSSYRRGDGKSAYPFKDNS
jgi:hypothetical protein